MQDRDCILFHFDGILQIAAQKKMFRGESMSLLELKIMSKLRRLISLLKMKIFRGESMSLLEFLIEGS
eukprot:CAMPEP_0117824694 /NCGR_PEP_ID=MMETSP0949-20121206/5018_1 /TAXON_ID=44440 /ORGANISM="Chattonella subsalsa, Strain CCMP2191" /LENGTH=67 /DNA_ID=CAMNT_0005664493 /DNA_START=690 /DNA_END=889 /DNA_ORIENTATION=-